MSKDPELLIVPLLRNTDTRFIICFINAVFIEID